MVYQRSNLWKAKQVDQGKVFGQEVLDTFKDLKQEKGVTADIEKVIK
jgi:hypothetical protein